jgi:hypothetical protein
VPSGGEPSWFRGGSPLNQGGSLRCHQLEAMDLLEVRPGESGGQVGCPDIGESEARRAGVTYHSPRYETH